MNSSGIKRVAVQTLGCKTNQFESAAIIEQFRKNGYEIVPFTEQAEIYLINSCTVTARSDSETRRLIRRARRLNPAAKIVATGCYAQVYPDELAKVRELDFLLGNREKLEVIELIERGETLVSDVSEDESFPALELESFAEHTRVFLQVQNGCDSYCSYCIVPYARGKNRSARVSDILAEAGKLSEKGYKEIVLTGIHLGAYGSDLHPVNSLSELVWEIVSKTAIPRIRVGSIDPDEIDDRLLSMMAESGRICRHLHIPVQSGSSTVLQRMKRGYDQESIKKLLERISKLLPDAFIGADFIAGFPGETAQEFQDTVTFVKDIPFSDIHVFPYSKRPKTKAAEMPGQLASSVITERAGILRELAAAKKKKFLDRFEGKILKVLTQGYDQKTGICRGLSRNFINVMFQGKIEFLNQELEVRVNSSDGSVLKGSIAKRCE